MGSGQKVFVLGAVIAFGVANAYYTFDPSLKDLKDQREGTAKPSEPQASSPQKDQEKEKKVDKKADEPKK